VKTPLWTDRPDKMSQFSIQDDEALSPDDVAKGMLDLVQKGEYGGGTVLEISMAGTRVIPEWNCDPPSMKGTGQEFARNQDRERSLREPISVRMKLERGVLSKL
jgi:hypothetical protein